MAVEDHETGTPRSNHENSNERLTFEKQADSLYSVSRCYVDQQIGPTLSS